MASSISPWGERRRQSPPPRPGVARPARPRLARAPNPFGPGWEAPPAACTCSRRPPARLRRKIYPAVRRKQEAPGFPFLASYIFSQGPRGGGTSFFFHAPWGRAGAAAGPRTGRRWRVMHGFAASDPHGAVGRPAGRPHRVISPATASAFASWLIGLGPGAAAMRTPTNDDAGGQGHNVL